MNKLQQIGTAMVVVPIVGFMIAAQFAANERMMMQMLGVAVLIGLCGLLVFAGGRMQK